MKPRKSASKSVEVPEVETLPFYKITEGLLPPQTLDQCRREKEHFQSTFKVPISQSSKEKLAEYDPADKDFAKSRHELQLRIFTKTEKNDLPLGCIILVQGINAELPPEIGKAISQPSSRNQAEARLKRRRGDPIDITPYFCSDRTKSRVHTMKAERDENADSEIRLENERVSILDPWSRQLILHPGRTENCGHLQCFDVLSFLTLNERKPHWNCPVCDLPTTLQDLYIDGYFEWVLESVRKEERKGRKIVEIEPNPDGTWRGFTEEDKEFESEGITFVGAAKRKSDHKNAPELSEKEASVHGLKSGRKSLKFKKKTTATAAPAVMENEPIIDLVSSDSEPETEMEPHTSPTKSCKDDSNSGTKTFDWSDENEKSESPLKKNGAAKLTKKICEFGLKSVLMPSLEQQEKDFPTRPRIMDKLPSRPNTVLSPSPVKKKDPNPQKSALGVPSDTNQKEEEKSSRREAAQSPSHSETSSEGDRTSRAPSQDLEPLKRNKLDASRNPEAPSGIHGSSDPKKPPRRLSSSSRSSVPASERDYTQIRSALSEESLGPHMAPDTGSPHEESKSPLGDKEQKQMPPPFGRPPNEHPPMFDWNRCGMQWMPHNGRYHPVDPRNVRMAMPFMNFGYPPGPWPAYPGYGRFPDPPPYPFPPPTHHKSETSASGRWKQ